VNVLLALAVNITVDVLLVPRMGILGAAIGWAAAILTNNLVPLAQVALSLRLHPLGRATLAAMALSAGCFGALPGLVRLLGGGLTQAVVALGVGAVAYLVGCRRLRTVLDLPALLALVPGRRGRVAARQAAATDDRSESRSAVARAKDEPGQAVAGPTPQSRPEAGRA
jgi:hypothetical protein